MKASASRSRNSRGWQKVMITSDNMTMVAEKLRECGQRGGDGDPVLAHAHFDSQNRLRRIHATYSNGWRATLTVRADGSYSLSQAIKLVSQPKVVLA